MKTKILLRSWDSPTKLERVRQISLICSSLRGSVGNNVIIVIMLIRQNYMLARVMLYSCNYV